MKTDKEMYHELFLKLLEVGHDATNKGSKLTNDYGKTIDPVSWANLVAEREIEIYNRMFPQTKE